MNTSELKNLTENLLETFVRAGQKALELRSKGLKKTINWYLENDKWVKFAKNKHTNRRIGLSD